MEPIFKKPLAVYLLKFLIGLIALSGLIGGLFLIISPAGDLLFMPLSLLDSTPFSTYFFPGLILHVCFGFYPTFVLVGLFNRMDSGIMNSISIYKENHWAWTGSVYIGIMLILWIDIQIMLIGYININQFIYAILGVLTVICALIPSVKIFYLIE
ncbi:MAG: hypothetical protein JW956_07550 [Calditrichaceae bacterium]|nr:hypothetical protein [Calditrichaceae bacterium]